MPVGGEPAEGHCVDDGGCPFFSPPRNLFHANSFSCYQLGEFYFNGKPRVIWLMMFSSISFALYLLNSGILLIGKQPVIIILICETLLMLRGFLRNIRLYKHYSDIRGISVHCKITYILDSNDNVWCTRWSITCDRALQGERSEPGIRCGNRFVPFCGL